MLASAQSQGQIAPKAVVVAVDSPIGDVDKVTSWSSMVTTASTTTWVCWVVTEISVELAWSRQTDGTINADN